MNGFPHLVPPVEVRPGVVQDQLFATDSLAERGYASRLVALGTMLLDVGAGVGICVLAGMAVVIAVMIARLHRDVNVSRSSVTSRIAQIKWGQFALAGGGLSAALAVVQSFIASHQDLLVATLSGAAVPTLSQLFAGHWLTAVVLLLSVALVVVSLVSLCRAIGSTLRLLRRKPTS